jgi:chromosome partitioning protein
MTQKTQVISVVQEKGGAGKTTWLCTLAALMAEDGAKVFAIDTDERKHLSRWLEKDKTAIDWTFEDNDELIGPTVRKLKKNDPPYDAIIIDTAGYKSATAIYAVQASDIVFIPCMPDEDSAKDAMKTYKHILNVAENAEKYIQALVVMMDTDPRANITASITDALDAMKIPRLKAMCNHLTGFKEMKSTGKAPDGAARAAGRSVLAELQRNELISFYGKGGTWERKSA